MTRKACITRIVIAVFAAVLPAILLRQHHYHRVSDWSMAQMSRLSKLTYAIKEYREFHLDQNPETLAKLIESEELDAAQYAELKFQQSPSSPPQHWLYFPNGTAQGWILSSPVPINYYGDSRERYLVSYPDGARELVSTSKWKPPPPSSTH